MEPGIANLPIGVFSYNAIQENGVPGHKSKIIHGGQACKPDSPSGFCNFLAHSNLLRTLKK